MLSFAAINFRLVFAYHVHYAVAIVTPRNKINLEKVLACLNTICTECGYTIVPAEIIRIDFDRLKCPKCGALLCPEEKLNPPTQDIHPHQICGAIRDLCVAIPDRNLCCA